MTLNNLMELWGMQSIPSMFSPLGLLWSRMVVPYRVLSIGQIEVFDIKTVYKQMVYAKLNCLK